MSASAPPSDQVILDAVLAAVPAATAVWLFGSATKGQWHAGSDLDIAVQVPGRWSASERFNSAMAMGHRLGIDVDLLDFQRLDTVMQVQILETGRLLMARDPVRLMQYEGFLRTEYQNIQRWRQPMMRALADRLLASGERR